MSFLREIMGIIRWYAFVDREFLVTAFLPDRERDHFRGSAENDKSPDGLCLDGTHEKLGPRAFHAFFFA